VSVVVFVDNADCVDCGDCDIANIRTGHLSEEREAHKNQPPTLVVAITFVVNHTDFELDGIELNIAFAPGLLVLIAESYEPQSMTKVGTELCLRCKWNRLLSFPSVESVENCVYLRIDYCLVYRMKSVTQRPSVMAR
jgi:hypothetical protein